MGAESDSNIYYPVYHPILEYVELKFNSEAEESSNSESQSPNFCKIGKKEANLCFSAHQEDKHRKSEESEPKSEDSEQIPCSSRPRRTGGYYLSPPPPKVKSSPKQSRKTYHPWSRLYVDQFLMDVPMFHYPIPAPHKITYSRWCNLTYNNKMLPTHPHVNYYEAIEKFQCQKDGVAIPHASTLIIGDSLLVACEFEKKLAATVCLVITFPYKVGDFAKVFIEKLLSSNTNEYSFKNIVISIGLELICYDSDKKEAVFAAREFIVKMLNGLHKLFPSKPPMRVILVTVPHVDYTAMTITHCHELDYFNEKIRKFISSYGREVKQKYNIDFQLFDWERKASHLRETTSGHIADRYQIFLDEISKFTEMTNKN